MTATAVDRNRDLARIHCLKRDLGLERDEYEQLLFSLARARSSADLDDGGRRRVIAHFQALMDKHDDWSFVQRMPDDRQKLLWKLKAMLRDKGCGKRYAEGISKKMFKIERLEMCAVDHLHKMVAALNFDKKRKAA